MKKRLTAIVLSICLLLCSGLFAAPARAESFTVYVSANNLKVYSRVSTSSTVLGTMGYGESMVCVAHNNSWAAVKNSGGSMGYCKISGLSISDPNNLDKTAYINTANTPIYRRPDTSSQMMMTLKKNSHYTAVAVTPDHNWVRLQNGRYYGYVQAKYISAAALDEEEAPDVSLPEETNTTVYITANTLKAYSRPSSSSTCLGTMSYGESMTLLSTDDGWARIRNSAGAVGYCKQSGISETNPNIYSEKVYINTDNTKVYRRPDTSASVMMYLALNSSYTAVAKTTDGKWLRLQNGKYYGYVQAKYVSAAAQEEETPEEMNTTVYIIANTLKVYRSASTSSASLGTVSYGESMTLLSMEGEWARICNSAGAVGYCKLSGLTETNPNIYSEKVYINTENTKVYRRPDTSADVMQLLRKNSSYTAVAVTTDGEWLRLQNGKYYGYIQAKYATNISLPEEETPEEIPVYVTATLLKVYREPSESAEKLGTVSFGVSLTLLGVEDGWATVRNSHGTKGYCKYSGLSKTDPNTLQKICYVNADGTKMYAAPSESASVVSEHALNDTVLVVAVTEDETWARIGLGADNFAYMAFSALSETKLPEDNSNIQDITPVVMYISDTTLDFHSENDADSTVLGTMSFGESVTCTGKGEGWARVKNASGKTGYCKLSGLTETNPNTASVTLYAQADGVKVYKKASTSSDVLTTLSLNGKVTGVATSADRSWVRVKSGSSFGYARSEYFSTSMVEDDENNTVISRIVSLAKEQLGVPYVYAAQSPSSGFDCSGLTYYVYKNAAGITLKRTAHTQGYNSNYPTIESRSDLKVGDLVFFNTVSDGEDDLCDHVGIYLGSNKFIHASSVRGEVTISDMGSDSSDYYYRTYSWGKRIIR